MAIDSRLEEKLGFDRVRKIIADRCSTDYAADRVASEQFSTDPGVIRHRLLLTDEMRLIVMFEESFPTTGYIDALPFLKPLLKEGYSIDLLSVGKLRTMIGTLAKVSSFFAGMKDGIYPNLKRMASRVGNFRDVQKRIDSIIDRYGEMKDTASDALYDIRKRLRDTESAISRRAAAILRKAQEDGVVEADASVNVRDGKFLIPVAASSKRRLQGFVHDESASGKTVFIEPVEIIEMENEISSLRFDEAREISRILYDFSGFLRPYVPELIEAATFLGEIDFIMAKAQTALDFIAGMPVISADGALQLRKARHPLLERALKKGVARLAELQRAVRRDYRHAGDEIQGGLGLCHDEIDLAEECSGLDELRHIRTEEPAEIVQDTGYLPGLVETQRTDLVLHLDDLDRLDEHGLARSGLVMDESLEPALGGRRDGDKELAVADINGGVGLDDAVLLGLAKYRRGPAGDGGLRISQSFTYVVKSI